jgi:hypothetical protein
MEEYYRFDTYGDGKCQLSTTSPKASVVAAITSNVIEGIF